MSYLLVAMRKGWVDGYYMDKELAEGAFESLKEQYPKEGWIMTEVKSATVLIPNNVFHTYARDKETSDVETY